MAKKDEIRKRIEERYLSGARHGMVVPIEKGFHYAWVDMATGHARDAAAHLESLGYERVDKARVIGVPTAHVYRIDQDLHDHMMKLREQRRSALRQRADVKLTRPRRGRAAGGR